METHKSRPRAERARKYRKEHKKRKSMKERLKSDKVRLKDELVCWKERASELQRYYPIFLIIIIMHTVMATACHQRFVDLHDLGIRP